MMNKNSIRIETIKRSHRDALDAKLEMVKGKVVVVDYGLSSKLLKVLKV
jgi:hypothetical protein